MFNQEEAVEGSINDNYKDYVFKLKNGENKVARGHLAVAQTFVAVGSGAGDLSLVVPLTELALVEELAAPQGTA